ncbi:adenosylcobinamide-GDP ribazoletransferase [Halomarina litorea]|uniref:adenosylcobinamide-GDP ribazoletransferase n=1 Tax=Halomarina litorea TaxID=2961595 RepID=UPI0020C2071D|nr:adenosylcobinamide-GDP ribazoletransferase [Halomarina sp. BCD28]
MTGRTGDETWKASPATGHARRLGLALAGALGFLSRLPVGRSRDAWDAFGAAPVAFPLAGYLVGALVAVPVSVGATLALPAPTLALLYLLALVLVTGVNHADGVADLGDAAVVHGDSEERRRVLKDTTVGVGAVLALGTVLVGLALAGLALAALPALTLAAVVVASEVGAKLSMAAIACLGEATHDGLGAAFTRRADPSLLLGPAVAALPACLLVLPSPAAGVAVVGGLAGGLAVLWWARRALGGVNGDVFGAANEVGRVCALHAGVVAWTLW